MLQRSIWINPFYSAPYILLGRAYRKNGQPATAEAMLRRAIQYDPEQSHGALSARAAAAATGRADEAKSEFEIAERLQGQPAR